MGIGKMVKSAVETWEAIGAKPTDAPTQTPTVDTAVQRLVQQDRYRSLTAALDAVDRKWRSNGQPHRFDLTD